MNLPASLGDREGFTLIEVVVAMVIAVFVILSITNLFVLATHQVTLAREDTGGALYAQEKIEQLMLVNRGSSELDEGQYSDIPAPNFLREWWIHDDNPAPGAKLLVVKVTPKGGTSPRPLTLAAVRAR